MRSFQSVLNDISLCPDMQVKIELSSSNLNIFLEHSDVIRSWTPLKRRVLEFFLKFYHKHYNTFWSQSFISDYLHASREHVCRLINQIIEETGIFCSRYNHMQSSDYFMSEKIIRSPQIRRILLRLCRGNSKTVSVSKWNTQNPLPERIVTLLGTSTSNSSYKAFHSSMSEWLTANGYTQKDMKLNSGICTIDMPITQKQPDTYETIQKRISAKLYSYQRKILSAFNMDILLYASRRIASIPFVKNPFGLLLHIASNCHLKQDKYGYTIIDGERMTPVTKYKTPVTQPEPQHTQSETPMYDDIARKFNCKFTQSDIEILSNTHTDIFLEALEKTLASSEPNKKNHLFSLIRSLERKPTQTPPSSPDVMQQFYERVKKSNEAAKLAYKQRVENRTPLI